MSRAAGEVHIHLGRRERAARAGAQIAVLGLLIHVLGKHDVDVVEMTLGHDRLRPTHTLLRGLDDDLERARPCVLHACEQLGGAKPDGDVGVVSAGVHRPLVNRAEAARDRLEIGVVRLVDGQGVDVEAHADGGPFPVPHNGHGTRGGEQVAHVVEDIQ